MKNSIRTLLVYLISTTTSLACGWYPFGEDTRFSLVNPSYFDDGGMSPYYYNFLSFGESYQSTESNDPNVALWNEHCGGNLDPKSIYEAVYELNKEELESGRSNNAMVKYLQKNDREALNYLVFAKSCSDFNVAYSYWERDSKTDYYRTKKILEALKESQKAQSKMIKKRYRYLAIRLAYYNRDEEQIKGIYTKSFASTPTDVIDYSALYFYATTNEYQSAEQNYNMAIVFANAPGKRFAALSQFFTTVPKEEVLALATTNSEKASVHAMYALRQQGRELQTLKTMYSLDPKHPLLNFLLVREVNKIEDWMLTPRYTNFDPSMDPRGSRWEASQALISERLKEDEQYARDLSKWLEGVSNSSAEWKLVEAYLKGMTGNEKTALAILGKVTNLSGDQKMLADRLQLLFRVKSNANKALSPQDQALLMNESQENYNLFLFTVAREYEFQNRLDVAAGLFSHVNQNEDFYSAGVTWRSGTGKQTLSSDFFYSWFLYLDAEYAPDELKKVIDFAKATSNSEFDQWQRTHLVEEIDRLYDLLGTKYVRKNDMKTAISAFEKVKGSLWEEYPYSFYLNANPFHADFYSAHRPSKKDTISYTKLELAKQYQTYWEKAENPSTKNRAYYYFLVANCELNMSHYGNSWMMRRYYWSGSMTPNHLEDDDEFFRVKRAKALYMKAYDLATTDKQKALCLRMAGRCEKHDLMFEAPYSWDFDYDAYGGYQAYFYSKNTSYQRLEQQFPMDADDLLSNCFSFQRYFAELKKG